MCGSASKLVALSSKSLGTRPLRPVLVYGLRLRRSSSFQPYWTSLFDLPRPTMTSPAPSALQRRCNMRPLPVRRRRRSQPTRTTGSRCRGEDRSLDDEGVEPSEQRIWRTRAEVPERDLHRAANRPTSYEKSEARTRPYRTARSPRSAALRTGGCSVTKLTIGIRSPGGPERFGLDQRGFNGCSRLSADFRLQSLPG